jgi:hypothetical protein
VLAQILTRGENHWIDFIVMVLAGPLGFTIYADYHDRCSTSGLMQIHGFVLGSSICMYFLRGSSRKAFMILFVIVWVLCGLALFTEGV